MRANFSKNSRRWSVTGITKSVPFAEIRATLLGRSPIKD